MGRSRSRWWFGSTVASMIAGVLVATACGSFGSSNQAGSSDGEASNEGGTDGSTSDGAVGGEVGPPDPVAKCNAQATFKSPVFFQATSPLYSARLGTDDVLYVSRAGATRMLGATKFLDGGVDSTIMPLLAADAENDEQAILSEDGLALVFQSKRTAPAGPYRLWYSSRSNPGAEFTTASPLVIQGAEPSEEMQDPWVTANRVYFTRAPNASAAKRLVVGEPDGARQQLTNVKNVFAVTTPDVDHPVLSRDELELFYAEGGKMKRTTRMNVDTPFQAGAVVTELDTGNEVTPTWISRDDCDLYYFTVSGQSSGLFKASRR